MPSRQDQLHSYQYSLQRVVAALVTHDPDPHRSPLRRAGTTALVSLVIAALAVGGAAVYGLLTGHSNVQLKDESVLFLEKGSGARYVYLSSEARLHRVQPRVGAQVDIAGTGALLQEDHRLVLELDVAVAGEQAVNRGTADREGGDDQADQGGRAGSAQR